MADNPHATAPGGGVWAGADPRDAANIEVFERELARLREGKIEEKVFLELRLRQGTYGQRQEDTQMQRIKIPLGMLRPAQVHVLADLAEEVADGILHVTTRQDIQLHFMDIGFAPELMRRLSVAGITTREACGNSVRNVCSCASGGVCTGELFDVTPHARAMSTFLLRHPDTQDFGRKFKHGFSGCRDRACGLARMHDFGAIATSRMVDGKTEYGFEVLVGGGLGPVPYAAQTLYEFVPFTEMLPLAQAISRVFARHGEKKLRHKARIKFLVEKMGLEALRAAVEEERARLPHDPLWARLVDEAHAKYREAPAHPGGTLDLAAQSTAMQTWYRLNTQAQKQPGYRLVLIRLPLGDFSAWQGHALAALCEREGIQHIRLTAQQNIALRWVPETRLPGLYEGLKAIQLAALGPDTLADVVACPGSDSCKLGITHARGLAATLADKFAAEYADIAHTPEVSVKISGCPNSCGQHHIASIGFFGSAKRTSGKVLPVYQVFLGGTGLGNAESYGLAAGKFPAHKAPEVVRRLADYYLANRLSAAEPFHTFVQRVGTGALKPILQDLAVAPTFEEAPAFFNDLKQPYEFKVEVGTGECAGAVVGQTEFLLNDSDRQANEATEMFRTGRHTEALALARQAMDSAAKGILITQGLNLSDAFDPLAELKSRLVEPGIFFAKIAEYYERAIAEDASGAAARAELDTARKRVEEATLFVEEAQVVYSRMSGAAA